MSTVELPVVGCCERLRADVMDAIDEITALRCPDPAAMNAFLTARLAMHTLRDVWLPHL